MQRHDPAHSTGQAPACFLVGRDSHGAWVAREQAGRCGGLFTTRAAAEKFVRSEAGDGAIIVPTATLELGGFIQ